MPKIAIISPLPLSIEVPSFGHYGLSIIGRGGYFYLEAKRADGNHSFDINLSPRLTLAQMQSDAKNGVDINDTLFVISEAARKFVQALIIAGHATLVGDTQPQA